MAVDTTSTGSRHTIHLAVALGATDTAPCGPPSLTTESVSACVPANYQLVTLPLSILTPMAGWVVYAAIRDRMVSGQYKVMLTSQPFTISLLESQLSI